MVKELLFPIEDEPYDLDHLDYLALAINSITNDYCIREYPLLALQKIERVFAYELYHQYKTIAIENMQVNDLNMHGEIRKLNFLAPIDNFINGINVQQNQLFPDLVLHRGQLNNDLEFQKLIIELKSGNKPDYDIKKEIIKLNHYISAFNFQYAVFLSVNTNFTTIENKLRRILGGINIREEWKRIIIINYKLEVLEMKRLDTLLLDH